VTFGALFDGEARSRTLHLANNSPDPIRFSIDVGSAASMAERRYNGAGGDSDSNPHAAFVAAARARAQALNTATSDPFEVSPRSGQIAPFSKVPLVVEYAPASAAPSSGFKNTLGPPERMHRFVAAFDFGHDASAPLMLPLSGTALSRAVTIKPERLTFGDVPCHEHRHLNCQLVNVTPGQAVTYRVKPSVAHFSVDPPQATIAPQATQYLAVIFCPKALGSFEGEVALEICSAAGSVVAEQTITVCGSSNVVGAKAGHAGGPYALPQDFKLPVKVADEGEIARGVKGRPPTFHRKHVRSVAPFFCAQEPVKTAIGLCLAPLITLLTACMH
jgi:hypothetical protein